MTRSKIITFTNTSRLQSRSADCFVTQAGQKEEQAGVGQVTSSLRRAGEGAELQELE